MWARTAEVMLGLWLLLSPFIFRHPPNAVSWWVNDLACGTAVILLALFSFWSFPFWRTIRLAHLGIIGVALWMVGYAFVSAQYPPQPALQNQLLVALLLMMFALVPTDAEAPPEEWVEYLSHETEDQASNASVRNSIAQ